MFSTVLILYRLLLNIGALSLISRTFISISDVPEFGGDPPSTAVNRRWRCGFFSRSRAFCSTNFGDMLSPLLCVSRLKYSFGLSFAVSIVEWGDVTTIQAKLFRLSYF
uniref:Secreted protein n=1 Tax=Scophthalmus maximus TaxID=52904 RepID=A0A8D2ZI00_SCOMX